MTNILIADTSIIYREGLKALLKNNESVKIIGEIKNGKEFWIRLDSLKPDILIADFDSLNNSESYPLSKIKESSNQTKIFILSNNKEPQYIINLIRQGALVYLSKDCDEVEFCNALDKIIKGEKYFSNSILDLILENRDDDVSREINSSLSERETEIIKLIAEGNSHNAIAEKLFLSIHTVYTHKKNIMRKLKIKSPVELILFAVNSGIIKNQ